MKKLILLSAVVAAFISNTNAQSVLFERQIQKTGTTDGVDESSDDGEQMNQEMDKLFDDDLDMGWEGDEFNIMTTGLRFTDVQIPFGAKIDSAYLIIYSHEEEKDTAKVTIYGQASDNTTTFSVDSLILDRPKTSAKVYWEITELWPIWTKFRTPNVTEIIQEIVDRQGWKSGNSLALFFTGQDQGASEKDNARDFESFENEEDPADGGDGKNHPERAPKLVVYYTKASTSAQQYKELSFTVYPNPSSTGSFSISRTLDKNSNLELFDNAGKLVRTYDVNGNSFSTIGLPAGFYTIKATKSNFEFTQKLILQ